MREEQIRLAACATANGLNGAGFEACGKQLAAVRFHEVQVQARTDG
jgi:hypothetical protein